MNTKAREKALWNALMDVAEEFLDECGSCGGYHFPHFEGDCRDDGERYGPPEDIVELWMAAGKLRAAGERLLYNMRMERTSMSLLCGRTKESLEEVINRLK
jgi:hypothetical protein